MVDFLIDIIYIKVRTHVFHNYVYGISIGEFYSPLLANLFPNSCQVDFLRSVEDNEQNLAEKFHSNIPLAWVPDL